MRNLGPKSILFGVVVSALTLAPAQSPDLNDIVSKMTIAQKDAREHMRSYQSVRQYQIFKGSEKKTEVMAQVSYLPPQDKSFSITKSTGGTGEHVVKKALEHEVEATRAPHDYEVNLDNYDFILAGEEVCQNSVCYVLAIAPKRNCKDLVEGHVWVDQTTFLIHKLDGELAKSPSWWVKKASIMVEYGNVEGMWLPTRSIATAKLRMIGDYRMIAHNVDMRAGQSIAANRSTAPSLRRRLATTAVVGESGFFLPRK